MKIIPLRLKINFKTLFREQFSCGRFMTTTTIPDDKSRFSVFDPLQEEIYSRGRTLLEEAERSDDFESYKLARTHYRSCIDEDTLERKGVEPLKRKLKEIGGWPVLEGDNWNSENNFTWLETNLDMI